MTENKNKYIFNFLIFLAFAFILFFYRINLLYYFQELNPDEAQFVSAAMRLSKYGIGFDKVYNGSSGLVNVIILMWPKLFNMDINIATARITDLVLLVFSCYLVFLIIRQFANYLFSCLLTLPLVFFYSFSIHKDFLHYSSERLPIFFILICIYFINKIIFEKKIMLNKKLNLYLIFFILGLLPYTKLQVGPIAILIGIFFALYIIFIRAQTLGNLLKAISFSFIPSIIFLVPLFLNGNIYDFYYGYILSGVNYIGESLSFDLIIFYISYDSQILVFVTTYLIFIFLFITLIFIFKMHVSSKEKIIFVELVLILICTIYVVLLPGRIFLHYLNLLFPILIILFSFLFILVSKNLRINDNLYLKLIMVLFTISFIFKFYSNFQGNKYFKNLNLSDDIFYERDLFKWMNPDSNDELVVWGWMCQFYIDTSLPSATKELLPFSYIYNVKNKEYFEDKYLKDIKTNNPNFVIDAVSPNSFNFNNVEKYSIQNYPKIIKIINDKYTLVSNKDKYNECPKIYVKNEKYLTLNDQLIDFEKIYSKNNLNKDNLKSINDSIVFEMCNDYWVLPDKKLDTVFLELKKEESVSKTMILNTKNGLEGDKGTDKIILNYYDNEDKVIFSKISRLKKYPDWTVIKHKKIKGVKKVSIEIVSFYANGAGLNEVKIYK